MSNHTPGPWRAEGGAIKAVSHGRTFTIATVAKKLFTEEGRYDNARLMAAAPDLLEALKICLDASRPNAFIEREALERIHQAAQNAIDAVMKPAQETNYIAENILPSNLIVWHL